MWVRRAAIRPVPPHARVSSATLEHVEGLLADEGEGSEERFEEAFARFESTQGPLSSRVADALGRPMPDTALALGYFLTLSVWMGFDELFGARLGEVSDDELAAVDASLAFDAELRRDAPDDPVETDDVVAMEQPDVVRFVREHVSVANEGLDERADVDAVDRIYRLVLTEIIALSYAVSAPERAAGRTDWSA